MNKKEMLIAALAAAEGDTHSPVQTQKLLFLIDREIADLVGGPYYNFHPYNYGPFDEAIYSELEDLAQQGMVRVLLENTWKCYELTEDGQKEGKRLLGTLEPKAQDFIRKASTFVRSMSFAQLVSSIYSVYPDMKENSVFQECR